MICRIEGRLVSVDGGRARLRCGDLTYELLVPAADEPTLQERVGRSVSFHTQHYLEGQGQGTDFVPRLIGFASERDREFFELFTTVKGMGNRKALRALTLPFERIAEAIARRDADILRTLPEVGPRTAQTIVAELHGKVDRFVELKPDGRPGAGPAAGTRAALVEDALMLLTQLGEPAASARLLAERALDADPEIETPDALLAAAYRLKES